VIVCAITGNFEESNYGITITTESMEDGHLKMACQHKRCPPDDEDERACGGDNRNIFRR